MIDAYKAGIDVTLLDENLRLTVGQRVRKLQEFVEGVETLRAAAKARDERSLRDDAPGSR